MKFHSIDADLTWEDDDDPGEPISATIDGSLPSVTLHFDLSGE